MLTKTIHENDLQANIEEKWKKPVHLYWDLSLSEHYKKINLLSFSDWYKLWAANKRR